MACRFDAWKNGAGLSKNNCLSLALYLCMIYLTTRLLLRIMVLSAIIIIIIIIIIQ